MGLGNRRRSVVGHVELDLRVRTFNSQASNMSLRKLLLALLVAVLPWRVIAMQWTATFDQVGPLRIGMSLAQVNQALGTYLVAPELPQADPTGRCVYLDPPRDPALGLMIIDGRLARIDVVKSGIKTERGVSVGDTGYSVLAAYGSRVKVVAYGLPVKVGANFYYRQSDLTVLSTGGSYGIRFETIEGKVTAYYSGTADAIQYSEGCA